MGQPVICAAVRTPLGKYNGALSSLDAVELGSHAIKAALERGRLEPAAVDEVIMGHVIQAGLGQITARQTAISGGVPMSAPAVTINSVCLSGMTAAQEACRRIRLDEARFIVAGGMESMSNAPFLLHGARQGLGTGNTELVDALTHDGLWCSIDQCTMGEASDHKNALLGIDRSAQDEWAAESHTRADRATTSGQFANEITPVALTKRRGTITITKDEGIRPGSTAESLGKLPAAFVHGGTITAGNASQVSDGAAALVIADRSAAEAAGMPILAEVIGYGQTAGPDATLHERPAEAVQIALKQSGMQVRDIDLFEINEAFASVALWSTHMLAVSPQRVNVNGGAVALGHPLGATGARLLVTLINALERRGGGVGAAALCGGGGQGSSLLLRVGVEA